MESLRRQKSEFGHREFKGTRSSYNRKQRNGSWQPTVPAWEKKFCNSVGSVPWKKIVETKKYMHLYDSVVQWDDSAGEEAFNNAKSRYWAEINGLPCDISLPDPDAYIDEVDWDTGADPELLKDLERAPDFSDDEREVTVDTSILLNQSFFCTGWGDEYEEIDKKFPSGPGVVDCGQNWESNCDPSNDAIQASQWGDGWDEWEQGKQNETKNVDAVRYDEAWRRFEENNWNREGSRQHMSRYKTSRFHGDNNQQPRYGWRNGRAKNRDSFACESSYMDKKPPFNNLNSSHRLAIN